MITASPRNFSFPNAGRLNAMRGVQHEEAPAKDDAAVKAAIARGYADGLEQGRRAAEEEAKNIVETARREGFDAGRAEALAQVEQAARALQSAAAELERERADTVRQAESFCVDLVLAIVSRLVESDAARAKFASRLVAKGLEVLAPEPPKAIYLNPRDRSLVGAEFSALPLKEDPALASGQCRIEAGRLTVEGGIDQALEQIKSAVLDVKERRTRGSGQQ